MRYFSQSRRQIIRGAAGTFAALALGPLIPAAAKGEAQEAPITKPIPSTGERLPVIGLGTNQYRVESPEDMARFQEVLEKMVAWAVPWWTPPESMAGRKWSSAN